MIDTVNEISLLSKRIVKPENLNSILNKLLAMQVAGIVSLKEIGKAIGEREQRVSEWVTQRAHSPNGETAIKLLAFAANRTLHISRRPHLAEKYRNAFEAACMKFPSTGEK